MTYLLDVNALLALAFLQHEFHERVAIWIKTLSRKQGEELATCSITELGFVRVLTQATQYLFTVAQAREALMKLKQNEIINFTFIADGQDISHLPAWVKTAKQTTDGHLAELARSNGAVFATLDGRIPRAFLIPKK